MPCRSDGLQAAKSDGPAGGSDCASKKMVWRGELHHLGDATAGSEPIFSCQKTVIPAESGVFIPF